MSLALAVDLGGTSLRAALIDGSGRVIAAHAEPMAAQADANGRAEADPEAWWRALGRAAAALQAAAPSAFAGVKAVAISAFTRTQAMVAADGRAVRPAILWSDRRAESILPQLRALLPPAHPETAAVNAFHPLARLFWMAVHEPDVLSVTAKVLEPKDYLNFRLTGRMASDVVSSARLDAAAAAPSLFAASGLNASMIPDLLPPVSVMGRVRAGLGGALDGLAGAAVISMANDTWASVLGLGGMRAGLAYNLSGTTEVFGVVDAALARADGLLSVPWGDGLHQLGGPSLCGGDTLVWLTELCGAAQGASVGETLSRLLAAPRAAEPLLFLPYLQGERTPYWDAGLRGAFVGLGRAHGPADIAFAALEGIAFLNRLVLERAEAATGRVVGDIRFGGGGAQSMLWRRIKADVTGRPLVSPAAGEGLRGAAIAAFTALGSFSDLGAAQDALAQGGEHTAPDAAAHERYEELYRLWLRTDAALAGISRDLSRMAPPQPSSRPTTFAV
jgi:xylulokinase